MTQLSAKASARCTNCSMRTIVIPLWRAWSKLWNTASPPRGQAERHLVGDDHLGGHGQARARASICCSPPESVPAPACAGRPAPGNFYGPFNGGRPLTSLELTDCIRSSPSRRAGKDASTFGHVGQASGAQFVRRHFVTSTPSNMIRPTSKAPTRTHRAKVLFPAPLAPSTATTDRRVLPTTHRRGL